MNATALLRPSRATLLGGLLGGAATSAGIALTATSGWLVVRAGEQPVILTLLAAIVAVRAFGMARPTFRYLERLVTHDAALADLARRRTAVYAALVPLTPARLGRRSRSRILSGVVDDLEDVVEAQVRVTVPLLSGAVAGLVATALTAWFAPAVGLLVAGQLLVVALGCVLASWLESRSADAVLRARAEVVRVCDLVARQAGELRAIGAGDAARRWLAEAHDVHRAAVRRQSLGRALVTAVLLLGVAAATLGAVVLVDPGTVGRPVAALLVLVPVAVGEALAPLTDTMRALARARGSSRRLRTLLARTPAVQDPPHPAGPLDPAAAPVIRLESARASWTGTADQLPATDLTLLPGRHVAVVGPNGSGKSTLLAVLARALELTGGRHSVAGVDVADLAVAEVRSRVAVVDDEPHVFAASLAQNLRLARPDAEDADLLRALTLAGLGPWTAELPEGLETRLGTGGRGISGGERSRLAIARAVLADRDLVLLDEPAAHLDHPTATAVLDDVLSAARDRCVVLVTHRTEAVGRVDSILELGDRPVPATSKE